jgi:hypothetical protein
VVFACSWLPLKGARWAAMPKAAAHTWVLFSHLRDIWPSYSDLYLLPFNLLTLPIPGIACFSFLVLRALWLYYGALSMSEEAV